MINNIQYFPSDTTRLYINNNVITGLLVSVSQNHLSDPSIKNIACLQLLYFKIIVEVHVYLHLMFSCLKDGSVEPKLVAHL